jgi:hypothetical protein
MVANKNWQQYYELILWFCTESAKKEMGQDRESYTDTQDRESYKNVAPHDEISDFIQKQENVEFVGGCYILAGKGLSVYISKKGEYRIKAILPEITQNETEIIVLLETLKTAGLI